MSSVLSALLVVSATSSAQSTIRASLSSTGLEGNEESWQESISANGRYLAFYSDADNLVKGDSNGEGDIFVRDLRRGITVLVSVTPGGLPGNGESEFPSLSANARVLAFYSEASDLVPNDTNGVADIFVRDLVTGRTQRVSVDSDGNEGLGASGTYRGPALSADGRHVVFYSRAPNLVGEDGNDTWDVGALWSAACRAPSSFSQDGPDPVSRGTTAMTVQAGRLLPPSDDEREIHLNSLRLGLEHRLRAGIAVAGELDLASFDGVTEESGGSSDASGFGLVALVRWYPVRASGWRAFVDVGLGLLATDADFPEGGTSVNGTRQVGAGAVFDLGRGLGLTLGASVSSRASLHGWSVWKRLPLRLRNAFGDSASVRRRVRAGTKHGSLA